jgi:hypothetical protein
VEGTPPSGTARLGGVYSIIGDHHVHGLRSLLYVGLHKSDSIESRWLQHGWLAGEWDWRLELFWVPLPDEAEEVGVEAVEGLLIKAHQPIYNTMKKHSFDMPEQPFTLWNFGNCPRLLPEVSSDHPWNL